VTRHFILDQGRLVHYRRSGQGGAVVLLHGTPRSSAEFAPIMRLIGDARTVIAPDLPGHGLSDPLEIDEPGVSDYALAIRSTLRALGIEQTVLYGRQLGALIAAEISRQEPALVTHAFLAEPPNIDASLGAAFLDAWAPRLEPRTDGAHLVAHWSLERDSCIFDAVSVAERAPRRLQSALPDASTLHDALLDRLRCRPTAREGLAAMVRGCAEADLRPSRTASTVSARLESEVAAQLCGAPEAGSEVGPAPRASARPNGLGATYAHTRYGHIYVRYRSEVAGIPLLLLHGSPSSGGSMEELVDAFAASRPVYSIDMLGGGESDKPDLATNPEFADAAVADFAAVALAALDALGLDRVDIYGNHTGAMVAVELAIAAPHRVRRLVLDGVTSWDDETAADLIANYFVDYTPAPDGSHLMTAWNAMRNATLWFPWYRTTPANILRAPTATPLQLHRLAFDALRRGEWHRRLHMPIFNYRAAERLPKLAVPAMICAAPGDVLGSFAAAGAELTPGSTFAELPANERRDGPEFPPFSPGSEAAAFIDRFLDAA
jgi:pimeloyl-ACP methyl ester carboxylesterase